MTAQIEEAHHLPLQMAQGRWVQDEHENQWLIFDKNNNELARLPACLGDFEAMSIIHFGRKFEKKAFEDGVVEGLKRGKAASQIHQKLAAQQINQLKQMNERLSVQLERHLQEV